MFWFAKLFSTYFYTGLLPKMPGTWGSLFALPLAWFLYNLGITTYLLSYLFVTLLGVWSSKIYSEAVGNEDPDEVVIDEVAGILTVFFLVKPSPLNLILALLLFRLIDITKPPPINYVEKIPHGIGIMADDILAGLLTGFLLLLVNRFLPVG